MVGKATASLCMRLFVCLCVRHSSSYSCEFACACVCSLFETVWASVGSLFSLSLTHSFAHWFWLQTIAPQLQCKSPENNNINSATTLWQKRKREEGTYSRLVTCPERAAIRKLTRPHIATSVGLFALLLQQLRRRRTPKKKPLDSDECQIVGWGQVQRES